MLDSNIKLRLKATVKPWMASSKSWIDSETISAIRRKDKLFIKYKKSCLETDRSFSINRNGSSKSYIKEEEILFPRKNREKKLIILRSYGSS